MEIKNSKSMHFVDLAQQPLLLRFIIAHGLCSYVGDVCNLILIYKCFI